MEEIIGLLVALAAIVFKVVGKRLEKSATSAAPEVNSSDDDPFDIGKWVAETMEERDFVEEPARTQVRETPVPFVKEAPRAVAVSAKAPKTPKKPSKPVVTEDAPKVREKIDPKKLVVYSEIMKPKFKEEN